MLGGVLINDMLIHVAWLQTYMTPKHGLKWMEKFLNQE